MWVILPSLTPNHRKDIPAGEIALAQPARLYVLAVGGCSKIRMPTQSDLPTTSSLLCLCHKRDSKHLQCTAGLWQLPSACGGPADASWGQARQRKHHVRVRWRQRVGHLDGWSPGAAGRQLDQPGRFPVRRTSTSQNMHLCKLRNQIAAYAISKSRKDLIRFTKAAQLRASLTLIYSSNR